MGLDDLVVTLVATANSLTADFQDTVTHEAWTGNDGYGSPTYATGVSLQAVVEHHQALVRDEDGNENTSKAKLIIVGPITAEGSDNRREPIDPRDRMTLPDGTIAPIMAVKGVVDPDTNHPYAYEVLLG